MPVPVQFETPPGRFFMPFCFHTTLADITVSADVVTSFTPGFVGSIVKTFFVCGKAIAGGGKEISLNFEIGSANLVGGVITLTSATLTPMGIVVAGTAITGGNNFDRDSTISIEATVSVAFADGEGTIVVICQERVY